MRELDAPYDRLDGLPRGLWLPGITASVGDTARRLQDLAPWLDALTAGHLPPPEADFADADALAPMREAVAALELPLLAHGVPAVGEQIVKTMLWHLDGIAGLQPARTRTEAIAEAARGFHAEWAVQKHGLEEELALLQGLGDIRHLRWDQLTGMLRSREWREAQRLSSLLAHLGTLVELIRAIGRSEHAPERPPSQAETARPLEHERPLAERETRLPDAPGELKGIRHSDRIERMLGSEAVLTRHPVLRKLWRARLAESRLLTYQSEAVLVERVPDPHARPRASAAPEPDRRERGPILLAVDTSGSMKGAPETIAKALVLEALRTAKRERRACLLIAFGGPGEVVERELSAQGGGLTALFELIGQGFDGGTDVQTPIEHAVSRVREARWRSADLVIVSDGEFGCTGHTLAALDAARDELGLRVQGVLIGDRETLGLMQACDDIFWLRDWRRFEGDTPQREGFVPVHSQSLTALYFPNALSGRAAKHRKP